MRPQTFVEDCYCPPGDPQCQAKCDANHISGLPARLCQGKSVAPGAHPGSVSRSKRKSVPRAKQVQPDRRDQSRVDQHGLSQPVARLSAHEVLEQIRYVRIERDEAEAELAKLIDAAVSQGVGWPQIASQLGVTRQAARQQYLRRHPDGGSHEAHVA